MGICAFASMFSVFCSLSKFLLKEVYFNWKMSGLHSEAEAAYIISLFDHTKTRLSIAYAHFSLKIICPWMGCHQSSRR